VARKKEFKLHTSFFGLEGEELVFIRPEAAGEGGLFVPATGVICLQINIFERAKIRAHEDCHFGREAAHLGLLQQLNLLDHQVLQGLQANIGAISHIDQVQHVSHCSRRRHFNISIFKGTTP
jgi:hypothetical protein